MVQQLKQVLAQKPKKALKLLQKMLKNIKKKAKWEKSGKERKKIVDEFQCIKITILFKCLLYENIL